VAGAIQDRHRGRVVGTRTFGKGVFQEVRELDNGGALDITVGEYFLPSGRNLGAGGTRPGAGIHPDVVARDRPGTRPDEALQAALDTLAGEAR
jgi:carboxyl-terminal processing protease